MLMERRKGNVKGEISLELLSLLFVRRSLKHLCISMLVTFIKTFRSFGCCIRVYPTSDFFFTQNSCKFYYYDVYCTIKLEERS